MGDDLDPKVRRVAHQVQMASASDPGSDSFREQLRMWVASEGVDPTADLVDSIIVAMQQGTFSQYL